MLTHLDHWNNMGRLPTTRVRVGKEETLIVETPQGKERFEVACPVCGERVTEVRRWRTNDGPWEYFTWHGALHLLGRRGRVRRGRRKRRG